MLATETRSRHSRFRGGPFVAWSVAAVLLALSAIALLLAYLGERGGVVSSISVHDVLRSIAIFVAPYGFLASVALYRSPSNRFGWASFLSCMLLITTDIAEAYGQVGANSTPRFAVAVGAVTEITWAFGPIVVVTLVPLLFPNGQLTTRAMRVVAVTATSGLLIAGIPGILFCLMYRHDLARGLELPEPYGIWLISLLAGVVLILCSSIAAIGMLVHRVRVTQGNEREQLKWFASGVAVVLVVCVLQMSNIAGDSWGILWYGTLILPLFAAIAIVRYRLFDIDFIISRTLLWGSMSAFVVICYVAVVGFAGSILRSDRNVMASLVATGLVAVLFQPARERMQNAVNRFVYGDRDEPYAAIARLGRRLEETIAPGAILPAIVETVAQALRVPYAAVTLRDGERFALASVHGDVVDRASLLTLPLVYNAEQVGQLILAPRVPGESLSKADHRLLEDLARQIGVAAHAVQLTADLQRSRERIVTAREEERRRLRNDLHDGLGPVLSGLKLRAETARNLVHDNPNVDELLADIADRTETAVADIRRLVYLLRPPALDDLGLVPALRQSAAHLRVPLTVVAPDPLPPLPAAVEVATYRIAQEALTNVARHARANSCSLSIAISDDVLELIVSDDGDGLPTDYANGVGLRSMRDRAEELGGQLEIASSPERGTTLIARLPVSGDIEKFVTDQEKE